MSFEEWFPDTATECYNPFGPCFDVVVDEANNYMRCLAYLNQTQPSVKIAEVSPMLVASYQLSLARRIIDTFLQIKILNPRLAKLDSAKRAERFESDIIWMTGLQLRYSDKEWPDYTQPQFQPKRKWNNRNDSIFAPYGCLPRGEYQYHFFIFNNLAERKIENKQQVRLKDTWEKRHPIFTGDFIEYMSDKNMWYKDGLEINSAIMMLTVNPEQPNPLPGNLVLRFTHLQKGMINPICMYWQYLTPDVPGQLRGAGYWSNYGVKVRSSNDTMTICTATHYGAFAVFMEHKIIKIEEYDYWGLITIIGTLVAIIMATGYLVVMCMFRLYRTIYNRIFMFTDLSVLMFNIFFLYAFMSRDSWDSCTSITAFLEFWHVQILTWMMIVNIHMLSRLREIFNQKTNIEAFYYILGWGIPIAVAVALQEFPHGRYEKLRFCWAKLEGFEIFYFGGPMLVLLLTQFIMIFLVMGEIKKFPEKIDKDINYIRAMSGIRSSITILLTVALMWVVGTIGIKQTGFIQTICMLAIPFLNIVLAGEILYYYFYNNDEAIDAMHENKKIKEYIRFMKFKHLDGIKMKVSYVAKEGDAEMENYEDDVDKADDDDDEFDIPLADNDDIELDDLVDFDADIDTR